MDEQEAGDMEIDERGKRKRDDGEEEKYALRRKAPQEIEKMDKAEKSPRSSSSSRFEKMARNRKKAQETPPHPENTTRKKSQTPKHRTKTQDQQRHELKTLVDMTLGGAERDKTAGNWKSSFHKSILCDVEELAKTNLDFLKTDDGEGAGGAA